MTEKEKLIRKICKIAKREIDGAGCRTVDRIADFYVDLLEELGEGKAAKMVYIYYERGSLSGVGE